MGFICGKRSGITVLDVDSPDGVHFLPAASVWGKTVKCGEWFPLMTVFALRQIRGRNPGRRGCRVFSVQSVSDRSPIRLPAKRSLTCRHRAHDLVKVGGSAFIKAVNGAVQAIDGIHILTPAMPSAPAAAPGKESRALGSVIVNNHFNSNLNGDPRQIAEAVHKRFQQAYESHLSEGQYVMA
jgi:hypothetical protein